MKQPKHRTGQSYKIPVTVVRSKKSQTVKGSKYTARRLPGNPSKG